MVGRGERLKEKKGKKIQQKTTGKKKD